MHAKGTVAFKRPGKMRWSLTDGSTQVIVADGTTLWFYQPDEQQVLKAPFRAAFRSSTPISFLTGVGRIGRRFRGGARRANGAGKSACPRAAQATQASSAGCSSASMRRSYDIVGAEIRRSARQRRRACGSAICAATRGLDDAQFHFEVPPGVDVIEAPIGN